MPQLINIAAQDMPIQEVLDETLGWRNRLEHLPQPQCIHEVIVEVGSQSRPQIFWDDEVPEADDLGCGESAGELGSITNIQPAAVQLNSSAHDRVAAQEDAIHGIVVVVTEDDTAD